MHRRRSQGASGEPKPINVVFVALIGLVGILSIVGLIEVLSASSVQALRGYGSAWVFFERQLVWLFVGTGALALCSRFDYRRWRRLSVLCLVTSLVLLVLVLVPGLGISVAGSTRWLGRGSIRMQPSELAKFGVLVFACEILARRDGKSGLPAVPPVVWTFVTAAALIMIQPDMGTTLVLMCVVMALLFVAGIPLRQFVMVIGVGAVAAFLLGVVEPYRRARITSFLHPFKDATNTGYQVAQSLVGIGSGGLFGVGVGASRAKWGFLPNAHTDFIFAIIGEELGLVGSLLVVSLFVAFAIFGMQAARRAPDRFGMLLATGITAWIVGQAVINIGAVIGLLPVTGVPLPFVSFGGSSLVILMAAVGVLLNIARQARRTGLPRRASPPAAR